MSFDILCHGKPIPFDPGVYRNVTRDVYDRIPALSSTAIKKWLKLQTVPSVFEHWAKNRWDEEPTDALILGSALDCMRLENGLFSQRYATVPPDAPRRPSKAQVNAKKPSPESLAAIAWWQRFNEESEGKQILTSDQMAKVIGMNRALGNAPTLTSVFEHCEKVVLIGEIFGQPAKAEIDLWNEKSEHILDIKTAVDVTEDGFVRAIDRFQYFEQAAWYMMLAQNLGFEKTAFDFVAVGNEPPYPVKVHPFVPMTLDKHSQVFVATKVRIDSAVQSLTFAALEDRWMDDPDWHPIEIPDYMLFRASRETL